MNFTQSQGRRTLPWELPNGYPGYNRVTSSHHGAPRPSPAELLSSQGMNNNPWMTRHPAAAFNSMARFGNDILQSAVNSLTSSLETSRPAYHNPQLDYLYSDPTRTAAEIKKLVENIRPDEDLPPELRKGTPAEMQCALLEHQKLGLTWLIRQEESNNKGGILADDMGLGKTIQALALLVSRKSENPERKTTLIIGPVGLLRQWELEVEEKLKPNHRLKVFRYHGQGPQKKLFRELSEYDVVLTTFGTVGSQWKRLDTWNAQKKHNPDLPPLAPHKTTLIDAGSKWFR
jgi:SNF2 family DNA or RNA helicase